MIKIRPFDKSESDYEVYVALQNAVWPDYLTTANEYMHSDKTRDPQYLYRRYMVELDGEIVGGCFYCEPWWSMKPGKYYLNIDICAQFRGQGIGSACYDFLMELIAERDPVIITASTRDYQTDAIRFLEKRGFKQAMRYPTAQLNVAAFDPKPFQDLPRKMDELGIVITPLDELQETFPDWKRRFYDLEWELMQDVPSPDPITRQTFENFEERTLGNPGFRPDGQMIALEGNKWVGMSGLWASEADREKLYTGLTGVVRSHRKNGIATAMKVRAVTFAKRYGARIIETENEENNPMYQINMRLGFEPQPAWLDYRKTVKEVEPSSASEE